MGETRKAGSANAGLGFLTVIEHDQLGLTGGYLILNMAGRPLEFHCTAPLKASRAQQILFGPTLAPYLYGEQIGQTLIAKAGVPAHMVWTDQAACLSVREHIELPVALVIGANAGDADRIADPAGHFDRLVQVVIAQQTVAIPDRFESDRERLLACESLIARLDLREPFARIQEAIEEAQRASIGRAQAA